MNNNYTYFLVNTFGKEIYLPDIKKRIPYNENELEIFSIDIDLFNESQDIKNCIRAKMIEDVTDQVLAKLANQENQVVTSNEVPKENVTTEATISKPKSIDIQEDKKEEREIYMVNDLDSSRALSGGDRNERIKNLESGTRAGAKKGILIDEYEDEALLKRAKDKRESFIVESDTRANPTFDPRLTGEKKTSITVQGINLEISNEALQKKNNYLESGARQISASERGSRGSESPYWANSTFGRERMAKQQMEKMAKQQTARKQEYDPRLASDEAEINPIFSDDFEAQVFPEEFGVDEGMNPLLGDLLESSAPKKTKKKILAKPEKTKKAKKKEEEIKEEEIVPSAIDFSDVFKEEEPKKVKKTKKGVSKKTKNGKSKKAAK